LCKYKRFEFHYLNFGVLNEVRINYKLVKKFIIMGKEKRIANLQGSNDVINIANKIRKLNLTCKYMFAQNKIVILYI